MVDINSSSSNLQARLQAQLQADRANVRPSSTNVNQGSSQQDIAREAGARVNDQLPADRRLPVKQSERTGRLSSPQELERAKERVAQETGANNLREAPVGRISVQQEQVQRDQPLGQIVDILV